MQKCLTAVLSTLLIGALPFSGFAQRYLTDFDSSLFIRDTVRPVIKNFENLHFSGYLQSQFQVIGSKGAETFGGGNFQEQSNSRFMLRRARMKMDYLALGKDHLPAALFTFQIDATERTVRVRDMFMRIYEPKRHFLSLTSGIFAKPFGYEVNLSSAFRETPERARISQTLLPSERGLGAMLSLDAQYLKTWYRKLKLDIGIFNGPGLSASSDFDSFKDWAARLTLRPIKLAKKLSLSAGLSFMAGGWQQNSRYVYSLVPENDDYKFSLDSSLTNIGRKTERRYAGADLQLRLKQAWGISEFRAEYWRGQQPGTRQSTQNPGSIPNEAIYQRPFDGLILYFLQPFPWKTSELILKYDWYDPNVKYKGTEIGDPAGNAGQGDIRYQTLGMGILHSFSRYVSATIYYEWVKNEKTLVPGLADDLNDNLLTARLQFRF